MPSRKQFTIATLGFVILAAGGHLILTTERAKSNPATSTQTSGPLLARGFTDARAGTVTVANNPYSSSVVRELRVKEGQMVQRGEIIAVMAQDPGIEANVDIARNNLRKYEMWRDRTLKGTHLVNLKLQEDELKSAIENERLATLLRGRSGRPVEEKGLEVQVASQNLANQHMSLELNTRRAAVDLEIMEIDVLRHKIALEEALIVREEGIIRCPIDGVVTQVLARTGERVPDLGIAKIVDMRELRVLATVDEVHLPRLRPDAPVEVTFRGSSTVYKGKIAIVPMTVKREKRSEADLGVASVRQVEVEIKPDEGVTFPPMLGREARVTFQ